MRILTLSQVGNYFTSQYDNYRAEDPLIIVHNWRKYQFEDRKRLENLNFDLTILLLVSVLPSGHNALVV